MLPAVEFTTLFNNCDNLISFKQNPETTKHIDLLSAMQNYSRRHSIIVSEKKTWHFMRMVCLVDNPHEISDLIFSEIYLLQLWLALLGIIIPFNRL